jgi:micrococcal nuclease
MRHSATTTLIALAVIALLALAACAEQKQASTPVADGLVAAEVERVVDGDTIIVELDGERVRVRYIGIDTPESVKPDSPAECFGTQASDANHELIDGRTVYLESDIEDEDDFGRLLRYVYVDDPDGGDRIFVNAALVSAGFAEAVSFRPNTTRQDELNQAESDAREARRGMWSACDLNLLSRSRG